MRRPILFCIVLFCCPALYSQVDVLTQHNDVQRTGWNSKETKLTTTNVKPGLFGKLYNDSVDDQVYAQPLVVTGVTIPGVGIRNVLYVATVNNTLYAFDADSLRKAGPYWQTNLTPAGMRPPKNSDMTAATLCNGNYQDFSANIGIVGTPVINKTAGTIYLVSRGVTTNGTNTYIQVLHAINIANGTERTGSPVLINASVSGSGVGSSGGVLPLNLQSQNQRPGLLLLNGIVYIGYASHCDMDPYHGWLLGYDATTLQQKYVYCTTPDGEGGGTWMAGNGPPADELGNIYISTGNGSTDVGTNIRNRSSNLIKLGPDLTVKDYFIPKNYNVLNQGDLDFGPCENLVIPGMNRVLTGAKDGNLYLADINNMGRFDSTYNNVVQTINLGTNAHLRTSFGYFKGAANEFVYTWPENSALKAWPVNRTAGNFTVANVVTSGIQGPVGQSGASISTSSNGSADSSAIVWVSHAAYPCDANHQTCPGIVRAVNGSDVTKELWNSSIVTADTIGNYAKFCSPTVANGKVYVASFSKTVSVYGLRNNGNDTCNSANIALNKPATASSVENSVETPDKAVDGDMTTRWSSAFTGVTVAQANAQWIYVDLGQSYDLCKVIIFWETALGQDFDIQVSNDAQTWTTVSQVRGNTSMQSVMPLQGSGRYVRMNGITRATAYGYSIFEMQVYGTPTVTCFPPGGPAASNIQQNSATLNWNAVAGATGYKVQYKATHDASWTTTATAATSIALSGLSCATDYLFQVATNCSNGQTSTYASGAFSTPACSAGCGPLPTRWTTADIGNPGFAGQACYDGTTFTLKGSGTDIGATSDQFRFAYVTLTGNDQFVTRVATLDNIAGDKAGVMIRQDLTASAQNAFVALSSGPGALFQYRSTAGGNTTAGATTAGLVAPYWLKLVKSGTIYSAYVSPNGMTWTQMGTSVDLGFGAGSSTTYAGLAITSHNNTIAATATADNYTQANPLPIELIRFTGRASGQAVLLQWSTGLEEHSAYFDVQRSGDGVHFASVATVQAAGSSTGVLDYNLMDEQPLKGINYYRLRLVDQDGKAAYSPVVLVRFSNTPAPMLVPNPASSFFHIVAGSDAIKEVNVYDLAGRRMLGMLNEAATGNLTVGCSHLSPGIYFVEIKTASGRYVQKLMKQ